MIRRVSIRTQLLGLTLAVALPLAGLQAWNIYAESGEDLRQTRQQVLYLAQVTASDTVRFLSQAHNILKGLATRADVRALDPTRCAGHCKGDHAAVA